jgi:phenylalanyl-tRNA synthetase beta chain
VVEPGVKEVRPFVVCLYADGLEIDEETVRQLIEMQEDLHEGIGRRRKKLAIGLHDASKLRSPIRYTVVDGDFSFVPLGSTRRMSVERILSETDVGRKYGSIVKGKDCYPVLIDADGIVLSLPPIINGSNTVVRAGTKELFVDVTGTDLKPMEDALAIISEALWDSGGRVRTVKVSDGRNSQLTPELKPWKWWLSRTDVSKLLGLQLNDGQIVQALKRTRLDASKDGTKIRVWVPRYRLDILHKVDLVEEVGYGFGFEGIKPDFNFRYSKGSSSEESKFLDALRRVAVGLGLQEVTGYVLASHRSLFDNLMRRAENPLRVESSRTEQYEYLRDSLTPGLLEVLSMNVHEPYPQKIFEIGRVLRRDEKSETGVAEELRMAVAVASEIVPFTDIRSILDTFLMSAIKASPSYKEKDFDFLISGRSALCSLKGMELGYVGEVRPEVLARSKIRMPVGIYEISLDALLHTIGGGRNPVTKT